MAESVEGARLLSECTPIKCTEGSNPSLSAIISAHSQAKTPSCSRDFPDNNNKNLADKENRNTSWLFCPKHLLI